MSQITNAKQAQRSPEKDEKSSSRFWGSSSSLLLYRGHAGFQR